MRCAIYARFSSERQNARSLEDQVRVCREYIEKQGAGSREQGAGWQVAAENIYLDEAVSGRSTERPGFAAMLAAAGRAPREFDCILVDDTSRVSRHQADALRFYERLAFAGVRLIAVSQGVDSSSEQAELMLGVHGLIDAVYSKELAQKTHRGMAGAALRGTATGGRCFGYRTQVAGSREQGAGEAAPAARWEVDEAQAEVVRRMFALSAGGMSLRKIAVLFNREGVGTPHAYRGQRHASWSAAALSVMLKNTRYAGRIIWNKTRKVRNPETGRIVRRRRPANEWMTREEERLRIVDEKTFAWVQERLEQMTREETKCLTGRRANYLLSGLLECAECGSKMVIVSGGRGRTSVSKYGCPLQARGVCGMGARVARETLEKKIIDALMARLSEPSTLRRIESSLRVARARERNMRTVRGAHVRELKEKIDRLADVIAAGNHSPALLARLRAMEERLATRPVELDGAEGLEVGALRAALAAKADTLKMVLVRMTKMVVRQGVEGRPCCMVSLGAGGQSASGTERCGITFEIVA